MGFLNNFFQRIPSPHCILTNLNIFLWWGWPVKPGQRGRHGSAMPPVKDWADSLQWPVKPGQYMISMGWNVAGN